ALEAALVKVMAGGKAHGALAWNEVGDKVWLPMWAGYAPELKKELAGVTPASLPELEWERVGRRLIGRSKGDPKEAADFGVGVGLALVPTKAGLAVEPLPGMSHALIGLGERVEVFRVRERLAAGQAAVDAWLSLCARAGIADADLGTACALSGV